MKIEFTNLGHIKSGRFEKSRLTILVGDNGSGKTTLLETVSLIETIYYSKSNEFINQMISLFSENIKVNISQLEFKKNVLNYLKNPNTERYAIEDIYLPKIHLELSEMEEFEFEFIEFLTKYKSEVIKNVNERIFNMELNDFDFNFIDLPKIEPGKFEEDLQVFDLREQLLIGFKRSSNVISLQGFVKEEIRKAQSQLGFEYEHENTMLEIVDLELLYQGLHKMVKAMFFEDIFRSYFKGREVLFLPSERSTYISYNLEKIGQETTSYKNMRYSEELFTRKYVLLLHQLRNNRNIYLSDAILELFEGKPIFDKDGEVQSVEMKGKQVGRHMFSTKINRIIPYLIIEHQPFMYSNVVVEEPEAHMSLKSLDSIIKYLLNIVSDNDLIITTHSDVFFNKIYNQLIKNSFSDIKVYELVSQEEGSELLEINKGEYGYKIKLFNEELDKLYDETIELQSEEEYD